MIAVLQLAAGARQQLGKVRLAPGKRLAAQIFAIEKQQVAA
jgi:hypothetical protein